MEDREAGDNVMVTSAKLINDGRDIFATMMMCGLSNGVGTYTLTFPMQDSFINPEIVMVINGEETLVDIASDTKDFIKDGSEICADALADVRTDHGYSSSDNWKDAHAICRRRNKGIYKTAQQIFAV